VSGYKVARLEEIGELEDEGRQPLRPVRHHFGITAFGITAWTGQAAGDRVINEHEEEDGDEELYFVAQGRAAFELDGQRVDAPAGTFVFVWPNVKRTAFAEEPGTTILAVGATPGKAYEPVGWELWAPVRGIYEAGDHETAVERLRDVMEGDGQYPLLLYNLACLESLTGRPNEALEHLRQAIAKSEQFRDYAKQDSDLDAIRDEPAFKQLVGT
jgi:quercetin dioxygenase-like cupin family protein